MALKHTHTHTQFMVSISSFESSATQHDAHLVNRFRAGLTCDGQDESRPYFLPRTLTLSLFEGSKKQSENTMQCSHSSWISESPTSQTLIVKKCGIG